MITDYTKYNDHELSPDNRDDRLDSKPLSEGLPGSEEGDLHAGGWKLMMVTMMAMIMMLVIMIMIMMIVVGNLL